MNNEQSPLHLLLNHRNINNFKFTLRYFPYYLALNTRTANKRHKSKLKQETILHALYRKETDYAPDLLNFIYLTLQINPSLS